MALSIGLDTASSGLRAMQLAIDTAAHNVANADTEGYSRQEVAFRAIPPAQSKFTSSGVPLQQLGLGVDVSRVRRLRDVLLDAQYRNTRSMRDEYQARTTALRQAEVTLNEPSDQGLQMLVSKFFNGLRDLANQPESVAARAAAVEQGATLAAAFNRTSTLLTNQRADLDASVDVKVADVNAKAREVADLNAQIRTVTVGGGTANDLMDRRDLLLDHLAGLTGATYEAGADNTVNVFIGARKLVDNVTVNDLATQPDAANANLKKVVWASDSAGVTMASGEIKGLLDARDQNLTGLLKDIDGLAGALITAVNVRHRTGYGLNNATGLDFFTGATAADMAVNGALRGSPESVAASSAPDEPGNANVMRDMAGVQRLLLLGGGTATIDDSYRSVIARLGVASQQAQLLSDNQDVVTRHLQAARASVSGVSIDEEMTSLVKGQHAYQASARVISVIDQMLDTLVNRMV